MKSTALVSGLVGVLAGFVGAAVAVSTLDGRPTGESAAAAGPEVAGRALTSDEASDADARAAELARVQSSELSTLQRRVDLLEGELSALRSERAREAVAVAPERAAQLPTPDALADLQRDAIVKVLEDQRKAEADKREAERKDRQRKLADEQAARAAKELGLGAGDERRLSDFLVVAGDKRDEMFRPMRDGANFDRDAMRQGFEDYRTWAESELKGAFGDNLGGRILDYQRQQRDAFGSFGGPPGGFGGGPGGGTSGDRGRRGGTGSPAGSGGGG